MPTGYDPTRLGVDAQSVDQIDPVAIYNLIATSDAFRSAGLTPEDLWQNVHPARIASTQGSGIGGMRAQRRLYTESQLGENKQSDVLQETLINVTAAYAGMMYHGGYGAMINPVAACATAAISSKSRQTFSSRIRLILLSQAPSTTLGKKVLEALLKCKQLSLHQHARRKASSPMKHLDRATPGEAGLLSPKAGAPS